MSRLLPSKGYLTLLLLLVLVACGPSQQEIEAGVAASVAATRKAEAGKATTAAQTEQAGEPTTTTTEMTPSASDGGETASECLDPGPPPDFSTIGFPSALGRLEQRSDGWYFNGAEVELVNHLNQDCSVSLWISLAGQTDWPLLLQADTRGWQLGFDEWNGEIVVMNTNNSTLSLELTPLNLAVVGDTEPQVQELESYEINNFASLPPGSYALSFRFTADQVFDLSCTVDLQASSQYVFSVVPIGVAVLSDSLVPADAADIDIATSPLCTN